MADLLVPIDVTDPMLVSSNVSEPDAAKGEAAWSAALAYLQNERTVRPVAGVHKVFQALETSGVGQVVTISIANQALVSWVGHGMAAGQRIQLRAAGGPIQPPFVAGEFYYVVAPSADAFNLSATQGGPAISTFGEAPSAAVHTAVKAVNVNKPPESSPEFWVEVSATTRWAPMDKRINTMARRPSPMTYKLAPGRIIQGIGLAEMEGVTSVRLLVEAAGGLVLMDQTYDLDATSITNWTEFFTPDVQYRRSLPLFHLPARSDATYTITLSGPGEVGLGILLIGRVHDIGLLQYGFKLGLEDYSRKSKDDWGNTVIDDERGFSETFSGIFELKNGQLTANKRLFASNRARVLMIVGVPGHDTLTEPTTAVGFYTDWNVEVPYRDYSAVSVSFEGLVQT